VQNVSEHPSATGHQFRRLEHDRVAVAERRRDLPGRYRDRKIPRRDDPDNAERFTRYLNIDAGPHGRHQVPGLPHAFTGKKPEDIRGAVRFQKAFAKGLALLTGQQGSDFVFAGRQLVRGLVEDIKPLLRRGSAPSGRCRGSRVNGGLRFWNSGMRVKVNHVRKIGRVPVFRGAGGGHPVPVNQQRFHQATRVLSKCTDFIIE